MNKNQREYLVTRIEKYNEQINDLNEERTRHIFLCGMSALAAIATATRAFSLEAGYFQGLMTVVSISNAMWIFSNLEDIIETIVKKVGLEGRIAEIEELIESDELREGRSR